MDETISLTSAVLTIVTSVLTIYGFIRDRPRTVYDSFGVPFVSTSPGKYVIIVLINSFIAGVGWGSYYSNYYFSLTTWIFFFISSSGLSIWLGFHAPDPSKAFFRALFSACTFYLLFCGAVYMFSTESVNIQEMLLILLGTWLFSALLGKGFYYTKEKFTDY